MKMYSGNKQYQLYSGNMLNLLTVIKPNSVDSVVCDPPYELGFMEKSWDSTGIAFQKETWEKCFEVLKPGGYLLAFGGSRTFHRIAVAIEDAGFELRDTIMWLYGSGFPKSMNIGKAVDKKNGIEPIGRKEPTGGITGGNWHPINNWYEYPECENEWAGWGTALKPSYEPVIVARKPFVGSLVNNIDVYGTGGLNIDECKIKSDENDTRGRFPSNVIFTYDNSDFEEVCGDMPTGNKNGSISKNYEMNNQVYGDYGKCNTFEAYNDCGSAARYFYCAKATRKDREEGLEDLESSLFHRLRPDKDDNNPTGLNKEGKFAPVLRKNIHPTVKPTELMQYLIRLVTPINGTILDPFCGSGSTGKAAMYESREHDRNYHFIGIELTDDYLPIAKGRIEYAYYNAHPLEEKPKEEKVTTKKTFRQVTIWDI